MGRKLLARPTSACRAVVATLLVPLLLAGGAASDSLSARVVKVAGSVRFEETDMLWKNVKVGTVLGAHSLLQTSTSKDSRVDLELVGDDGRGKCTIRLFPNSVLRLIRMNSKAVGPVSVRDLGLGLAGRILVSLDGAFDYDVELTG